MAYTVPLERTHAMAVSRYSSHPRRPPRAPNLHSARRSYRKRARIGPRTSPASSRRPSSLRVEDPCSRVPRKSCRSSSSHPYNRPHRIDRDNSAARYHNPCPSYTRSAACTDTSSIRYATRIAASSRADSWSGTPPTPCHTPRTSRSGTRNWRRNRRRPGTPGSNRNTQRSR